MIIVIATYIFEPGDARFVEGLCESCWQVVLDHGHESNQIGTLTGDDLVCASCERRRVAKAEEEAAAAHLDGDTAAKREAEDREALWLDGYLSGPGAGYY